MQTLTKKKKTLHMYIKEIKRCNMSRKSHKLRQNIRHVHRWRDKALHAWFVVCASVLRGVFHPCEPYVLLNYQS